MIITIKIYATCFLLCTCQLVHSQSIPANNTKNIFFDKIKEIKERERIVYWANLEYGENTVYGPKVDNTTFDKTTNLNGTWTGTLIQSSGFKGDISFNIKQYKNQIAGNEHMSDYKNKNLSVDWKGCGYIEGKKVIFTETAVLAEKGGNKWCMKSYTGEIVSKNNNTYITGTWENNQYVTTYDIYGKLIVAIAHKVCAPGTFEIKLDEAGDFEQPDYHEFENITENEYYQYMLNKCVWNQSGDWSLNKYTNGSMRNIQILGRDKAGNPNKIKGTYDYTKFNETREGWVEMYFTNQVPYYMYYWDDKLNFIQPDFDKKYSQAELAAIKTAQANFKVQKEKEAKENTRNNYKEIVSFINSKYAKFDIGNYLVKSDYYISVPSTREVTDYDYRTTSQGTLVGVPFKKQETYYTRTAIDGLKNTGDHRIVIKGIRKFNSRNGGINYEDISIGIDPGETISFVLIENLYDDTKAEINSDHYFRTIR